MGRAATAAEKRHHDRVAAMGCLVCGAPATIHHVTAPVCGGRITRDHRYVAPLCPPHHQKVFDPKASDPISVEGLGHRKFALKYGIDLLEWAKREWKRANG